MIKKINESNISTKKLRIREAMDPSIPSWLRKAMSEFGKPTGLSDFSAKVDIANTTYHDLPIPRTSREFNKLNKDPNRATVVHFKDIGGHDVVWVVGFNDDLEVDIDDTDRYNFKPVSKHTAKNIIPRIIDYGYVEFSDDIADLRKSRKANRPNDRDRSKGQHLKISHKPDYEWTFDGRVYAQGPSMQTWETEPGYDKSGYPITGLNKYKRMLANMGLTNYQRTLDRLLNTYEELVGIRRKLTDRESRNIYTNLVSTFNQYLDYMENYYDMYSKNPEENDWYEEDIVDSIRHLNDHSKKVREFISIVNSGSMHGNDWYRFRY